MAEPKARSRLVSVLRRAHAGELAAAFAYAGHWRSLPEGEQRQAIQRIEREELDHRRDVGRMLYELGASPSRPREAIFWLIGKTVGALCHVSGWFAPMYGAGRLERGNIVEYEGAAHHAREAGYLDLVAPLVHMSEVEARHERFFREKVLGHWLSRIVPLWPVPVVETDVSPRSG